MTAETVAVKVNMEPFGPRFIAIKADVEEVSPGGIHLPSKAQEKQQNAQPEAIVIRISKSLEAEYGDKLKPGVRVLLNWSAPPQFFKLNGQEFMMVDLAQVKGVYEE